jgi:hypothetical protein
LIDKNKYYRTTGILLPPHPVTLFATNCRGQCPVVGVVHYKNWDGLVSWTPEGRNNYSARNHLDLVEITKAEWDAMMEVLK